MLRNETATLTLKRGIIVRGQVTDPAGKPIKDAIVVHGDHPYSTWMPSKFPTDADGRFRLPALSPRQTTLTVIAAGFAPQFRRVDLQAGLPPQNFRMEPGKPIRLRFVDAAGKPVPNVDVSIVGWKGSESLQSMHNPNHPKLPDTKIPHGAGADGVWLWTSAPDDPVKLQTYLKGFAACDLEIAGGAPQRTVTLKTEHRITGRITDAVTGKPISAFTVIPIDVFRKDWLNAERMNAEVGKDGRLDYLAKRTDIPLRLRVEATGYRTQTGPEFRVGDDTSRTQDFRLQPSPPVAGVVLDAAGRPVVKAEVLLATQTEEPKFNEESGISNNHVAITDAAGRFEFPDPGEAFIVAARADAGFAQAEFPAARHDTGVLRLQPWAAIRGQFRDGGRPVRGALILVQPVRIDSLDRPRIDAVLQTRTDASGRFEFKKVSPLPVSVRVYLGPWMNEGFRSGPSVPLDLQPGQQAELDLGGAGTIVKGKVTLTGKVPADLDCTYSLNYLVRRAPGIAPPPAIAGMGFDIRKGWQETWPETREGNAYLCTLRHWVVKLAPDGAFRISGVPPGEYDLAIGIYAKPSGCLVDPLAQKVVHVTVTEADAARGELALPEISAVVAPVPAIGDTPAVTFHRANGADGSLTDFRGHYTVLHFWASWCGPCKQQLPALRQLHDRFAARGLAALGVSLDDDPAAWEAALKRLDLPWLQGRVAAKGCAGVSSVPAYWLLDPAGKIVAKANDPDELTTPLAERLK
ncbi:MAG: carboxypeptidase regulatory-like domain-containing protein, partial [Thermoguttaceae bacterium]